MKFAVFVLFCLSSSAMGRPDLLPSDPQGNHAEGGEHQEQSHNEEAALNNAERASLNDAEGAPAQKGEPVKIIKYESDIKADGTYNFEVETEDGLVRTESGTPGEKGAIYQEGKVSFTFPSGEQYEMTFVADLEGFKPESPWIPVAPENPHPIPQFALDQIEKAKQEDELAAQEGESSTDENLPEEQLQES